MAVVPGLVPTALALIPWLLGLVCACTQQRAVRAERRIRAIAIRIIALHHVRLIGEDKRRNSPCGASADIDRVMLVDAVLAAAILGTQRVIQPLFCGHGCCKDRD